MLEEKHANATMGAGGLLLYKEQVLLVQMNYGRAKGAWILPGGMVEEGETPIDAVEREVLEETGLQITTTSLLSIRHRLQKNNTVNIYWVFLVEPKKIWNEIPQLIWPKEELMEARFWSVNRALEAKEVRPMTREFLRYAISADKQTWKKRSLPQDHFYKDIVFG